MGRLIVLDASVAIAALAADDAPITPRLPRSPRPTTMSGWSPSPTRAEILVGPSRVGGVAFATARNFVDGCATIAVTASIADDTAALRARQRTLSLPDAIALVVANLIDADAAWTF